MFLNLILAMCTFVILLIAFAFSIITMPQTTFAFPIHVYLLKVLTIIIILLTGTVVLVMRSRRFRDTASHVLRNYRWYLWLANELNAWKKYMTLLSRQALRFLALVTAKDALYFITDIIALESCFLAFHIFPPISLVAFAYIVSLVAGTLSLIPAGLGPTDATLAIVFLSANIDPVITVGVILLYRLVSFFLPIPLGAISYYSLQRELRRARSLA
jgi:uncharacterized protein (TIRG00374 family)